MPDPRYGNASFKDMRYARNVNTQPVQAQKGANAPTTLGNVGSLGQSQKDPRYAASGQALKVESQYYDRDPYPKFFEESIPPNKTISYPYQNGTEEISEVKRIRIQGHPDVRVAVRRTKDNQDQTVLEERRIGDIPIMDGWHTVEFRKVSADVPLIIEKNQTLYIDFTHTLGGNQTVTVDVDKQAVRFYLAR